MTRPPRQIPVDVPAPMRQQDEGYLPKARTIAGCIPAYRLVSGIL